MENVESINRQLQKKFNEDKGYHNLEKYVMSELMSPIEDYINAIDIIRENCELVEGLDLYYIAAYLCAEWMPESTEFLEKLNSMISVVEDRDKAIIYYLNAHSIACSVPVWKTCEQYRFNLLNSIQYSKNIKFVNNFLALANISEDEEAKRYIKEARSNIEKIETRETLKEKMTDYWLSSRRYVEEFILGTSLSHEVYMLKFPES